MTAVVLWTSLALTASAQTPNDGDRTDARIATAMAGLSRFQSSRSIEDLRETSNALFSAIDPQAAKTGDVVGHRRSIVAAYARVLAQIDALTDPTVDLTELPSLCVIPPREPDGRQLPACANPNDISDAGTRARYVAEINANSAKIARRNAQGRISILGDNTTSELEIVLSKFRSRAPADASALDTILRRAGVSEARRSKIHAMY